MVKSSNFLNHYLTTPLAQPLADQTRLFFIPVYPPVGLRRAVLLPLIRPLLNRSDSIALSSASFKLRWCFAESVSRPCRKFGWFGPALIDVRFLAPCRRHVRHPKAAGLRQRCFVDLACAVHCVALYWRTLGRGISGVDSDEGKVCR